MSISLSSIWFNYIHSNFLLYNTCWEDSDIDRKLLTINQESNILAITSAGCNVLNYLLDKPASIHCVDINPKQTALLELKVALIKQGIYEDFWSFFGEGKSMEYQSIFERINHLLSPSSLAFWKANIDNFSPQGKGFFYSGGAGIFAQFLNYVLRKKDISESVLKLIYEPSKEKRAKLFSSINEKLWDGYDKRIWKTPLVLSLVGVPKTQRSAIKDMNAFMKKALHYVFVEQNPVNNPFWRVYIEGCYSKDCCPDYLRETNFDVLQEQIDVLKIHTEGISQYLSATKKRFDSVVLLDYMDWLTGDKHHELSRLWQYVLRQSESNGKVLFRTAHPDASFLPDFVNKEIDIQQIDQNWILHNDRVGTYSGTYLGFIQ